MSKKVVVEQTSVTAAQMSEFWRQVAAGGITGGIFQTFLEHRSPFGVPDIDCAKVYTALGMEAGYAAFATTHQVAENPALWTIPVIKGATCNKVVAALRQLGTAVHTYARDSDNAVPVNDRDPNRDGSYVVSFRRNVEADEDNHSKSANVLAEAGHKGITFLERLLLELGYFLATGKHLDEENWTLCAGSRYSGGDVPRVNGSPGYHGVCVDWYSPGGARDGLRSRSAVS